ncbi:MAG: MFS transporter, partial [Chloroflexi bacterium]|nr:MFS transporter [Chloroflexota bacterium]
MAEIEAPATAAARPLSNAELEQRDFRLRSLIWTVYLPSFMLSIGTGLLVPIVPLFARDLGASVGLAAFAVGVRELGTVLFDLPVGTVVARFGRRNTMIAGTAAIVVLSVLTGLSTSIGQFIAWRFLMGGAMALWSISRHAYIADTVPVHHRGKALSLFGGMGRLGSLIGPIIGGYLGERLGFGAPFFVQSGFALVTLGLVVTLMRDVAEKRAARATHNVYARIGRTVAEHRRDFATAGIAAMTLQLVRNARQVIIPLWGAEVGLGPSEIGLAISIAAAVDMTLFYPAGLLMDRFGRKSAMIPSLLIISCALAVLPLTHSFTWLTAVAVLAGIGNGLSSGVVLTLGAD